MRRLLIVLLCVLLLALPVSAAESEVTSLKAEVQVQEDGNCDLTLTAQIKFSGSPEEFVFPLAADADNVAASGAEYKIRRVGGVRCAIFQNDHGFTGSQSFTCSYRLPCAVKNGAEKQVFTLALPEKGWDYPISSLELSITFPAEISARPSWNSAYYGDIVDNYLDIQIGDKKLSAKSNGMFQDQETITMNLAFEAGSFRLRNLPGTITSFGQVAFFVLLLVALVYWLITLRGKILLPKTQHTHGMEATAGEISCQLFGDFPDVAAILAHWGNLGYVGIYRNAKGRIILRRQMEMGSERKPAEQKLFKAIFRKGGTCDLQSIHFHSVIRPACYSFRYAWNMRLFSRKSGNPQLLRILGLLAGFFMSIHLFDLWLGVTAWRWVLIPLLSLCCVGLCYLVQRAVSRLLRPHSWMSYATGLAATALLFTFAAKAECTGLMFLNFLLQIFCAAATLFGGKRSEVGNEQVRQLLGLRRHLWKLDGETVDRLMELDGQYFYRMLPFAHMLGVGRAFAKAFDTWTLESCPWLTDARYSPGSPMDFYHLYIDIFTALQENNRSPVPAKAGRR